jgi:lysophospholipase L1-like esterase
VTWTKLESTVSGGTGSTSGIYSSDKHKNKKLIALGDSITWQDGKSYASGPQAGVTATGYLTLAKNFLGLTSFANNAVSGADMVNSSTSSIMVKGMAIDYTLYDIVTILGGTNDYGHSRNLGTLLDVGSTFDELTFYGAYQKLIEYIMTSNPQIQVYLITPPHRNYNYTEAVLNGKSLKLLDYVNAVKDIGALYSMPVIDLYRDSGINRPNLTTYTRDGLHPIDIGYVKMAKTIIPAMQTR